MPFMIFYEALWLAVIAYPLWRAGTLVGSPVAEMAGVLVASPRSRRVDAAFLLVALAAGLTMLALGAETLAAGALVSGAGVPVPMTFFMGTIALLAAASDVRVLRAGGLRGRARLTRHLLRMCFALWIAAGSFFLGQADEFPAVLRAPALLATPVLAPLAAMAYWRWRVRAALGLRGAVRAVGPTVATATPRRS